MRERETVLFLSFWWDGNARFGLWKIFLFFSKIDVTDARVFRSFAYKILMVKRHSERKKKKKKFRQDKTKKNLTVVDWEVVVYGVVRVLAGEWGELSRWCLDLDGFWSEPVLATQRPATSWTLVGEKKKKKKVRSESCLVGGIWAVWSGWKYFWNFRCT